jgi:DNA-binding PadR family transcriptional regulator
MSLRFTLLGLLALEPASGYDLKRTIERSTYFIWNATGPQIYSTLRKLREDGYITSEALPQTGKPDKEIHTITPDGRGALQDFMNEPIRSSVTAHPGRKHEARRFQLLSLRLKVAQYRAMEKELARFCGLDLDALDEPAIGSES